MKYHFNVPFNGSGQDYIETFICNSWEEAKDLFLAKYPQYTNRKFYSMSEAL